MKKRLLSMILVLVIVIGMVPMTAFATASNDYTQWRQGDAEWNQAEAWPAAQYPGATLRYMSQAGCLVTSIAMLLRHYNVVTDSNVNNFNPWICNERLKAAGAFNSAADLYWTSVQNAYSGFVYAGSTGYSASQLVSLYNQGYACVVSVNNGGHFVAVQNASSTSNITIMDPGWGYTSLSSFGGVNAIYYFQATPSNQVPVGHLNSAVGGINSITVRGWAYDPDSPETSIEMHFYVDNEFLGSCIANKERQDVNNAYGCGKYHGFEETFEYQIQGTGTHTVRAYALDTTSGLNNSLITDGERTTTVTADTTGPSISNVQVAVDNTGYTVSCEVRDDSEITKVQFPTWSDNNGQDDLLYAGDGRWKEKNLYLGTLGGGTATYHVNISDHNYDTGIYHTHIYTFDEFGNVTIYEIDDIEFQDLDAVSVSDLKAIDVTKEGFTLACNVTDNVGVEKVQFYLGDRLMKYEAIIENGVASCFVPFSDHEYAVNCEYLVTVSTTDVSGNSANQSMNVYVEYDAERKITYHLDGGTNNASNPSVYSVLNPYINLQAPTKEGYTFVEWYVYDEDNNKVVLTYATELSGENVDVYASWTCNHSWDAGVVVKEATCIAKGERKHTCRQCGKTKTEQIEIGTHIYKDGECTVCGAEDPNYEDVAAKITVSTVKGTTRSTVKVNIVISENPGIVSATLRLDYDTSVLTLVEVTDAGKLGVQSHKPELTSPYTLVWVNDTATENYDYNGTIVTLTFEIAEGAILGDYIVDVSYDYNNYDIYNADAEKVKFATVDGVISVIDIVIGDANGDGTVNNLDRMILTRYLADWDGYVDSIDLIAADVNNDGLVNNLDRMILTRHLANWEGYATIPYVN